jgi:hypothetical protein
MRPVHTPSLFRVIGFWGRKVDTERAMTVSLPIISRLANGTVRRLRTASICLLGVAASISVVASVPKIAAAPKNVVPAQAESQAASAQPSTGNNSAARHVVAILDTQSFRGSVGICLCEALATPRMSAIPHGHRRIFVEGTSPLSTKALTEVLQAPPDPNALSIPPPRALPNELSAGSNRQRAP